MASGRKRLIADGSKRYDVVYRDLDGRQRWKTYRRKVDAEAFANMVEADKVRGSYIDPDAGKVTVKACGETWLGHRTSTRAPGKPSRAGRFRRHVYSQLGGRQFRQVRPSTIQAWLRGLGLADSTTKVVFANLSTLFAAAVNDELIGRNPCRSLRTQSEGRAARRPAVDQADLTEGPPAGDVDQLAGLRGAEVDETLSWSGPYGVWTTISRRAPPRRSTGRDRPRESRSGTGPG